MYDLVVSHHQKKDTDEEEELTTDEQLKRVRTNFYIAPIIPLNMAIEYDSTQKVQEFVNDLIKITRELQREQLVNQESTVNS